MKQILFLRSLSILLLCGSACCAPLQAAEQEADLTKEAIKKLPPEERLAYIVSMFSGKKAAPGNDLRMPDSASIVERFDTDRSGGLSQSEFPKMPDPRKFAKLDRDKSGELDLGEMEQLVEFINKAIKKQIR